jgi:DNA-binding HxlR family transcriptional regulator
MTPPRLPEVTDTTPFCSIERTVDVLGDRWSFLLLRETILYRHSRFSEFQAGLGIATNVLASRLEALVAAGILERVDYQDPGARTRPRYEPTPRGEGLRLVLAALQQWGDEHLPRRDGPTMVRRSARDGGPVDVAFVDATGQALAPEDVQIVPVRLAP